MTHDRVRNVRMARLLLALATGTDRFGALQREAVTRNPDITSRLLKKMERNGHVVREALGDGRNPLATRWRLTPSGEGQVEAARSILMTTIAQRTAREAEHDVPIALPDEVIEVDRAERMLLNKYVRFADRICTGAVEHKS